jgi:tetratricopeptide (TPR) repeat protein
VRTKLVIIIIVLMPLVVFWQTRNFEFVWDDEVNVAANRYLNPVTPENVLRFWQEPYERLYVPLTYTVWAISGVFARGGNRLDPKVFHSANILFHILSALVVFAIVRTLIRHDWAACTGALLFALHPIQVESVAWITGMKDILSGFLSLVALWQYLLHSLAKASPATPLNDKRKRAKPSRGGAIQPEAGALYHYAAATAAFILAMLAKPSAAVTPVIAIVLDWMVVGRSVKDSARSLLLWLIAALPFIIATKLVQPESDLDFITPLWARPFVAADAIAFYLYKTFIPLRLAPDYGRLPELVIEGRWSYFTWVVPVAVGILLYCAKGRRWWLASGAIFVIGILPVSGLLPFSFQNTSTVADRYVYLSMLGPALAASWLVSQGRRRLVAIATALVILSLGIASAVQARHWHDDQELFGYALKLNPGSWVAYYSLGRSLAKKGETDKAIASFREAARLKPEFTNAHFSLAGLQTHKGQYDEAIAAYRQSLSIAPNFLDARLGLGHTLILRGDLSGAVEEFSQALKIDPNRADIYFNLANLQARIGHLAEAAESLNRALRIKPDFAVAHNSLGRILAAQGDLIRATDHFREAVRIEPTFADAHESLALALAQQGKTEEAARYSQEARRLRESRYRSIPPSTSFR